MLGRLGAAGRPRVVETGRLNRVVHIWSFEDLGDRRQARERWWLDPERINDYLALPLVESQETTLMSAASFSPIA